MEDEQREGDLAADEHDDYIDRRAWPILYVTFPENLTLEGLDRHFTGLAAEAEKRENFAAIVDLDAIRSQTRELRQHAAAHLKKIDASEASKYLVGVAHVSDHWLNRAGLTVVLSLSPPPYPNRAFRRVADAEDWIRTLLAKASA